MNVRIFRTMILVASIAACKRDANDAASKRDQAEPSPVEGSEPSGQALPDAAKLLDRAAAAMGGKERIAKLESLRYSATVTIPGQNITGSIIALWKRGDFYTETTMVGIGKVRGGRKGDVIWSEDPINGLRKLESREAQQATWAASPVLPAEWTKHFSKATTLGERRDGERTIYDVRLSSDAGDEVVLGLDAATHLPVSQRIQQVTPMGEVPVTTKMEDYRDVGGVKLPFRQQTDMTLAQMTMQIDELEVDVPVDEAMFVMPDQGTEVVKLPLPGQSAAPVPTPANPPFGTNENRGSSSPGAGMPFGPDGKPGKPVPREP